MKYYQRLKMRKSRLPSMKAIASAIAHNPPVSRYKTDPLHRLRMISRSRISSAIRKNGYTKTGKTQQILGCSFEELKRHIEKQFCKGMNWKNYGKWHVDHRIPIASANTPEEMEYLLHYLNLQPMWASQNMAKGADIPDSVQLHLYLMHDSGA